MKRVLFVIIAVILMGSQVFAEDTILKEYTIVNDTGDVKMKILTEDSEIITPGLSRIMGFTVTPTQMVSNAAPWASLYDADNYGALEYSNLKGETEGTVKESVDCMFPYPKVVGDGLGIVQGPYTTVIVHYTR